MTVPKLRLLSCEKEDFLNYYYNQVTHCSGFEILSNNLKSMDIISFYLLWDDDETEGG